MVMPAGLQDKIILVFDTETTGLKPDSDRIIQISGLLTRNGKVLEQFSHYVNPGIPIQPAATRKHKITNEMLSAAPNPEEIFTKIGSMLKPDMVLAAYNSAFDVAFLTEELKRVGFDETTVPPSICIMTMARIDVDNDPSVRTALFDVVKRYNLSITGEAHDANVDAAAALKVMNHLFDNSSKFQGAEQMGLTDFQAWLSKQNAQQNLAREKKHHEHLSNQEKALQSLKDAMASGNAPAAKAAAEAFPFAKNETLAGKDEGFLRWMLSKSGTFTEAAKLEMQRRGIDPEAPRQVLDEPSPRKSTTDVKASQKQADPTEEKSNSIFEELTFRF